MSELSKIIMCAATPEQIAFLLCRVATSYGIEIPSSPDNFASFAAKLDGAVRKSVQARDIILALQDAHNNAMRF